MWEVLSFYECILYLAVMQWVLIVDGFIGGRTVLEGGEMLGRWWRILLYTMYYNACRIWDPRSRERLGAG